jgi:hypothetical protein
MRITYSQRLLAALLNIDTDNNIMNNTKEYKLMKSKDKTIKYKTRHNSLSLSLSLSLIMFLHQKECLKDVTLINNNGIVAILCRRTF